MGAREHKTDTEMDRRMESSSELNENSMFLNLNDDCIEAIFRWLPLANLCSLSLTCKRAFKLTNQYFHRQYPNHCMNISNTLSGPIIKYNEYYVKCFRSSIQNIRFTSDYWNLNVVHLFTFLRMNCCENLRELEFDSINLKSKESYGAQIHAQLKNLTTISFINCSTHDIHNGFLQYCDNLKHLIIKEEKLVELNCKWTQEIYPNLKSLVYYVTEAHTIQINIDIQLQRFLSKNSHIKNIAGDHRIVYLTIESLQNIHLEYLVVRIEHAAFFTAIFNELKSLCEERRIERIRLVFGYSVAFTPTMTSNVASLQKYVTLDLSFTTSELEYFLYHPILQHKFDNVKLLSLEVAQPIPDRSFHLLPITVPNLEEIHLKPWWKEFIVNFRPCIGTFAAKFKDLKTLVIHLIDPDIIPTDAIIEMDFWRKKITGACVLTIYFPYEVIQKIKFIIPMNSCVKVKSISALKRDIFTSDRRLI